LDFFKELEGLSDVLYLEIEKWRPFARTVVGGQLARAIDSVGANLVEGDARYSNKESLQFFSIARASGREARYWLRRAEKRSLISAAAAQSHISKLES